MRVYNKTEYDTKEVRDILYEVVWDLGVTGISKELTVEIKPRPVATRVTGQAWLGHVWYKKRDCYLVRMYLPNRENIEYDVPIPGIRAYSIKWIFARMLLHTKGQKRHELQYSDETLRKRYSDEKRILKIKKK